VAERREHRRYEHDGFDPDKRIPGCCGRDRIVAARVIGITKIFVYLVKPFKPRPALHPHTSHAHFACKSSQSRSLGIRRSWCSISIRWSCSTMFTAARIPLMSLVNRTSSHSWAVEFTAALRFAALSRSKILGPLRRRSSLLCWAVVMRPRPREKWTGGNSEGATGILRAVRSRAPNIKGPPKRLKM